jgi:hypothetical protein
MLLILLPSNISNVVKLIDLTFEFLIKNALPKMSSKPFNLVKTIKFDK